MPLPQPELSQPKRAAEDVHVSKHAYVRVHVQPKRFPAAYTVDWKVGFHMHKCQYRHWLIAAA